MSLTSDKNKNTLQADQYTFLIISRSFLLRVKNISAEACTETQNTHFVFSTFFFLLENRAVYEVMWKIIVKRGRLKMIMWHMRIACWIPKATHTHTQTHTICNTHCFSNPTPVV